VTNSGVSQIDATGQAARFDNAHPLFQDELFDQIFRFNLFPAEYAHESWLNELDAILSQNVATGQQTVLGTAALRSYSRVLLRRFSLEQQFDFDFTDMVKRIALIPSHVLHDLGRYVCAVLARESLQKVITQAQLGPISQTIGLDARMLALRWDLHTQPLSSSLLALNPMVVEHWSDQDNLQRFAMRLMLGLLPEAAVGVRSRFTLKYPQSWLRCKPMPLEPMACMDLFGLVRQLLQLQWPVHHQKLWPARKR
jgi:YOP proteins translocation protein K (YscK)